MAACQKFFSNRRGTENGKNFIVDTFHRLETSGESLMIRKGAVLTIRFRSDDSFLFFYLELKIKRRQLFTITLPSFVVKLPE